MIKKMRYTVVFIDLFFLNFQIKLFGTFFMGEGGGNWLSFGFVQLYVPPSSPVSVLFAIV